MTDQEIIEYLKNNRYSKAANELYGMLPAIKKYISANNGTPEDAKDIFQDALVVLYKKVHTEQFVLTVPLQAYMHAVVKNLWLAELRNRKKIPLGHTEEDMSDLTLNEEPGFSIAEAAFGLLGEKCRQLLILFYFKKKSFREIASSLAFRSENVAKNQKYRCLQKAKDNYLSLSKTDTHE
ncbi:MAG TPA: sigma-70 family RNA polymerase sigma factor [Ferruginibacter sp.]|nr:sigma-70 family RNA polymerase sigma factor [Ferruginibacter sp.]